MSADGLISLQFDIDLPEVFPSPFDVRPHPVAVLAAQSLQKRLVDLPDNAHQFDAPDGGKMFGVLVVRDLNGATGYLAGYSGMLGNCWQHNGFVPPVFDQAAREKITEDGERCVAELTRQVQASEADPGYQRAIEKVQQYSDDTLQQIEACKQRLALKKQHRQTLRDEQSLGSTELAALANESRQDKFEFKQLKAKLKQAGADITAELSRYEAKLEALKKHRKKRSASLQSKLFEGYKLLSSCGESCVLNDLFETTLPPSGAGDCAATKLVQYANANQLIPIALAEFWWGAAPAGGLREHGRFYPSCRSRCRKVLPFMLRGQPVSVPLHEQAVKFSADYPRTLFEDNHIVVVEKPAGLLSVPGKVLTDSVEARLKTRYPEVSGVMLLHRLDQATSGVMIGAKNPGAYKSLQHQFQDRTIKKQYIALLDGLIESDEGVIELPLRIDFYDRPRQIVCHERGKSALTKYRVISRENNITRIAFFPHTGRTHQLRVHAAHPDGLNCPILGDELYGRPLERLHLHAAELTFTHPVNRERLCLSSEVTF